MASIRVSSSFAIVFALSSSVALAGGNHALQGGVESAWEAQYDSPNSNVLMPHSTDSAGDALFIASRTIQGELVVSRRDATSAALVWKTSLGLTVPIERCSIAALPDGSAVFVGAWLLASGSDSEYLLARFDGATGAAEIVDQPQSQFLGYRFADLCLDPSGERLYAVSNHDWRFSVSAYDTATSARLWEAFYDAFAGLPPFLVSTTFAQDLVATGAQVFAIAQAKATAGGGPSDFVAIAFDAATGQFQWDWRLTMANTSSDREAAVSAAGDLLVVATGQSSIAHVLALDTVDGNLRWSSGVGALQVAFAPDDSVVYVAGKSLQMDVTAFDPSDGSVSWAVSFPNGTPLELELVEASGLLAVAGSTSSSSAFARVLAPSTGAEVWSTALPYATTTGIDALHLDASADGNVLALTHGGPNAQGLTGNAAAQSLELFGAADGFELAHVLDEKAGEGADVPGVATASPDGARVFVGVNRELSAWDAETGARVWSHFAVSDRIDDILVSPDGSRVYRLGSNGERIFAVDAATGAQLWQATTADATGIVSDRSGVLSPDGTVLYRGYRTDLQHLKLRVHDAATGALQGEFVDAPFVNSFSSSLALSADGAFAYLAAGDRLVAVDTASASFVWGVTGSVGSSVLETRLAFLPSSNRLLTALYTAAFDPMAGGIVDRVYFAAYDAATGASLYTPAPLEGFVPLSELLCAPDGGQALLAGRSRAPGAETSDFAVVAFDPATGAIAWQKAIDLRDVDAALALSLGADGNTVIASGTTGALPSDAALFDTPLGSDFLAVAFDLDSGAELWRATYDGPVSGDDAATVACVAAQGERLVVAGTAETALAPSDLGLVAYDLPSLVVDRHELSVGDGGRARFGIRPGTVSASHLYQLAGSTTGTSPGTPIGGGLELPLVADAYFQLTLAGGPPFKRFAGALDAQGLAGAALVLPPSSAPSLVGLRVHHAFFVVDPVSATAEYVSNSVQIVLAP